MKYWLHFYSQQRYGSATALTANVASKKSPATFLLGLVKDHPDNESKLHWSTEITAAEYKKLEDQL